MRNIVLYAKFRREKRGDAGTGTFNGEQWEFTRSRLIGFTTDEIRNNVWPEFDGVALLDKRA